MARVGISEAELARNIKLPQTTINQILRGQTKDPRMSTLILISQALEVSIDQLVGTQLDSGELQGKFVPVIDWEEVLDYLSDSNYPCSHKKWLAVMDKNKERYFALKTTVSMEPRFRRDSLIIIKPTNVIRDGATVIVSFNDTEPTIRFVIKDGADLSLKKLQAEPGEKPVKVGDLDKILGVVIETRFEIR